MSEDSICFFRKKLSQTDTPVGNGGKVWPEDIRDVTLYGAVLLINFDLSKESRTDAIASIKRYFEENMSEPIGDLAATLLLNFFLEEIGPVVYNRAVADAQTRMQLRIADLSGELYADEFQYWSRVDAKRNKRR